MTSTSRAHLSVIGANVIFGINYSMVKFITTNYMHPWAMNLARIGVSTLLLWGLFFMGNTEAGFKRKDLSRFVTCAVVGVAINQLLFTKGLSLTTSIHASLLALGTPIFITAIAAWILREKFTWNKALGLSLGVGGAVLLIVAKSSYTPAHAKDMLAGDIMVIINAISYAFYFVWVKPLMGRYSFIHVLRWTFTIGLFFILPFGLPPALETNWQALDLRAWLALGFIIVGATFLAYLLNVYGLKILGASATGTYIYTQPIFASIIGVLFLNERFSLVQVISFLMIGIGVYIVNRKAGVANGGEV